MPSVGLPYILYFAYETKGLDNAGIRFVTLMKMNENMGKGSILKKWEFSLTIKDVL